MLDKGEDGVHRTCKDAEKMDTDVQARGGEQVMSLAQKLETQAHEPPQICWADMRTTLNASGLETLASHPSDQDYTAVIPSSFDSLSGPGEPLC